MTERVYYNEFDPFAAQWLRNLMASGLIPEGDVDERSIVDVRPADLQGYGQAHFFAGIGGWAYALRLAGWPSERPVWTGSCPCQPFSVAGKGKGVDDERHLWPAFHRLIAECAPAVVFGEQVASAAGRDWLDGVRTDLEALGYAVGAADLCAAGVDAPHIRQRLYWVAVDHKPYPWEEVVFAADCDEDGNCPRCGDDFGECNCIGPTMDGYEYEQRNGILYGRPVFAYWHGDVEHADRSGQREYRRSVAIPKEQSGAKRASGDAFDMADADGWDAVAKRLQRGGQHGFQPQGGRDCRSTGDCQWPSFWSDAVWLTGADGKSRRAKSGVRLLAHGVPNRVRRLRGFGNAIVPQVAAEFVGAMIEATDPYARQVRDFDAVFGPPEQWK